MFKSKFFAWVFLALLIAEPALARSGHLEQRPTGGQQQNNLIALKRSTLFLKENQDVFEVKVVEGFPLVLNFATLGETPQHLKLNGKQFFHVTHLGTTITIEAHQPISFAGATSPGYQQGLLTVICESKAIFQIYLRSTNNLDGDSLLDLKYDEQVPQQSYPVAEVAEVVEIPVPQPIGGPSLQEAVTEETVTLAPVGDSPGQGATEEPDEETIEQLEARIRVLEQQSQKHKRKLRKQKEREQKLAQEQAEQRLEEARRQKRRKERDEQRLAKKQEREERRRARRQQREDRKLARKQQREDQKRAKRQRLAQRLKALENKGKTQPQPIETRQAPKPLNPLTTYTPQQLAAYLTTGTNIAQTKKEIDYSLRRGSAWLRVKRAIRLLKQGKDWQTAVQMAKLPPKFAFDLLTYGLPKDS